MARYEVSGSALVRRFAGETSVLTPDGPRLHVLDETATMLLEAIRRAGGACFDDLLELEIEEFHGSQDRMREDLYALLDELVRKGILVAT